jgi:hypothetical protein
MNELDEKLVLLRSLGWSEELIASVTRCDEQNLDFMRVEDPMDRVEVHDIQHTWFEVRPIFAREVVAHS